MNTFQNLLTLAGVSIAGVASAQVSFTGSPLSQNFDTMGFTAPASYPDGWSGFRYAGSGTVGALTLSVTDGTSNSGALYSVGSLNSSERALGALGSSSTIGRFGLQIANNSGGFFNVVDIGGVAEQWRSGSSSAVTEKLEFELSFNATGVNDATATWTKFSALDIVEVQNSLTSNAALNGNDPANFKAFSASLTGFQWESGAIATLRWSDANDTGSDAILALDNFTFSASSVAPVPEPSTWALFGAGVIGLGLVVRRKCK